MPDYFEWLAGSAEENVKREEADKFIEQFRNGLITVRELGMKLLELDEEFSL